MTSYESGPAGVSPDIALDENRMQCRLHAEVPLEPFVVTTAAGGRATFLLQRELTPATRALVSHQVRRPFQCGTCARNATTLLALNDHTGPTLLLRYLPMEADVKLKLEQAAREAPIVGIHLLHHPWVNGQAMFDGPVGSDFNHWYVI